MELPARFGKYELIEHLATGGMAEVFLARSFGVEGFEKRLVIKRILPALSRARHFISLFIQEARVTAGLSHPNIVQFYELGKVGDEHYIAMEHIHGRDLTQTNRALRREGRRMPVALAVYVVAKLLRGLGYAHSHTDARGRPLRLVHRDVSPHNVLLSFQGEVKLFDFGIARLFSDGADPDLAPAPGRAGGKFAYMSPEQAAGRPIDRRSDIYAAGIVLYELLVGHRLFQDPDPEEKLRRVLAADVTDPRVEVPEIPDGLWAILKRLLARDPDDRPARAELAEEELLGFLYSEGMRADAAGMVALLGELFPEASADRRSSLDLEGLAADLGRLRVRPEEPTEPTGSDESAAPRPAGMQALSLGGTAGERKPIFALVAEVLGFTDLPGGGEPEQIVRRHLRFLRRIRSTVERFGGRVEHFQDDTLIIFFGVPRATENDLERSLAAATALHRATRRMTREGLPVSLGIGIHRGEVTVAGGPHKAHHRYLAQGDTMKLARRLCFEAEAGQTLVSDRVAALAGDRFRFGVGPDLRLKGHPGQRRSFLLLGPRHRELPTGGAWLPRSAELDVLREALECLARERGGVVLVSGPTGSGKSRLVRELMGLARLRSVPLYAGRALPYEGDRPLAPFRELVGSVLGVESGDAPATLRERLLRLGQLHLSESERGTIAALFAVDLQGRPPETSEDAVFRAAAALVLGLAEEGPVLLVMEDVHNLDPLEQRLLGHVVRVSAARPVLFLFTARDATAPTGVRADWEIALGRLDRAALAELVRERVGAEQVGAPLLALVDRTAEGNPLYVEAVLGALTQAGRIHVEGGVAELVDPSRDPQLPPDIEGLISARIDALDPVAKGTLQLSATLGMSFPPDLLAACLGQLEIEATLRPLEQAGLINRDESGSEERCTFSSSLVWEVVRRSILGMRRRDLHRVVADGIERLYADRLDLHRQVLARHCAAGGRYLDAARHAEQAGIHLHSQQLVEQAATCWDKGISWVEDARASGEREGATTELEINLRLRAGAAWALVGASRPAEMHLQVALDLAAEVGDTEVEARAELELGRLYRNQGQLVPAGAHLDGAHSLAICAIEEGTGAQVWARTVAVEALESLGRLCHELGEHAKAAAHFEEARARAGDDDRLATRALLGLAAWPIRREDEAAALALLEEALRRSRRSRDRILIGRVINNIGIVHHGAGRYDAALDCFREALELRQGLGYRQGMVVNLHNIGDTHTRRGEPGRAWAAFTQSRDLAQQMGWEPGVLMSAAWLSFLEAERMREDAGEGVVSMGGSLQAGRIREAAARAEALGDPETGLTARWLLGRLLIAEGRRGEARTALLDARARALRLEARGLLRDVEDALSRLDT